MTKFISVLILFLFAVAGVALTFIDFNDSSSTANVSSQQTDYASLVLKDDFSVRSLLARIVTDCGEGDKECIAVKSYRYVISNYILNSARGGAQSVQVTLTGKEGSAEDLSVLLASFLAHGGIDQRLRLENGNMYVYACGLDPLKLYRHIVADMRTSIIATRDVVLRKEQVWAIGLSGITDGTVTVDITAKSSKPFDMYMFPDKVRAESFLKEGTGRYVADCSKSNVTTINLSCAVPDTSVLVFISKEDANPFSGTVYKGGFLLGDIKEVKDGSKTCVPMDVVAQGAARYPGVVTGL